MAQIAPWDARPDEGTNAMQGKFFDEGGSVLHVRAFGCSSAEEFDNAPFLETADATASTLAAILELGPGTFLVQQNVTIANPVRFSGGILKPDSGVTITLESAPDAGAVNIFDLSEAGTVVLPAGVPAFPQWFGAVGDATTDDSAALIATNAAASEIVFPAGTYIVDEDVTFAASKTLRFLRGAALRPQASNTVTINAEVVAGRYQIFDLADSGTVTLGANAGTVAYPEWWASLATAFASGRFMEYRRRDTFVDLDDDPAVAVMGGVAFPPKCIIDFCLTTTGGDFLTFTVKTALQNGTAYTHYIDDDGATVAGGTITPTGSSFAIVVTGETTTYTLAFGTDNTATLVADGATTGTTVLSYWIRGLE